MYIYIEQWTPKQAWLDLSPEERGSFVESIMPVIQKHEEELGVETLAMASIDPDTASKSKHTYLSALRMPDLATAKEFERDLEEIGWYDYFDQTNARGKIRPPDEVIGEHIAM